MHKHPTINYNENLHIEELHLKEIEIRIYYMGRIPLGISHIEYKT